MYTSLVRLKKGSHQGHSLSTGGDQAIQNVAVLWESRLSFRVSHPNFHFFTDDW